MADSDNPKSKLQKIKQRQQQTLKKNLKALTESYPISTTPDSNKENIPKPFLGNARSNQQAAATNEEKLEETSAHNPLRATRRLARNRSKALMKGESITRIKDAMLPDRDLSRFSDNIESSDPNAVSINVELKDSHSKAHKLAGAASRRILRRNSVTKDSEAIYSSESLSDPTPGTENTELKDSHSRAHKLASAASRRILRRNSVTKDSVTTYSSESLSDSTSQEEVLNTEASLKTTSRKVNEFGIHTAKPIFDASKSDEWKKIGKEILEDLEKLKKMEADSKGKPLVKYKAFEEISRKIDEFSFYAINCNLLTNDRMILKEINEAISLQLANPETLSGCAVPNAYLNEYELKAKIVAIHHEQLALVNQVAETKSDVAPTNAKQVLNSLNLKNALHRGDAESISKALATSNETQTLLKQGPKNKNIYSYQLETIIKAMLNDEPFKVENTQDNCFVTVNMHRYDLNKILKNADFTHIEFTENDKNAYMALLCDPRLRNKPDDAKSYAKDLEGLEGKEKIAKQYELMDKSFLESIDRYNASKPESEQDDTLKELSTAERMAINIYTTGFYEMANPLMRGRVGDALKHNNFKKLPKELALKEILCSASMAMHGLAQLPDKNSARTTFRGDDGLSESQYEQRVAGYENQSVVSSAGFISTKTNNPGDKYAFNNESKFKVGVAIQVFGKDIKAISRFDYEDEVAGFGNQIIYDGATKTADNEVIFKARVVNTLTGLTAEQTLTALDLRTPEIKKLNRKEKKIHMLHRAGAISDADYEKKLIRLHEKIDEQIQIIADRKQSLLNSKTASIEDESIKIDKLYDLILEYNNKLTQGKIVNAADYQLYSQAIESVASTFATNTPENMPNHLEKANEIIKKIENDMKFSAIRNAFLENTKAITPQQKEDMLQSLGSLEGQLSFSNNVRLDGLIKMVAASKAVAIDLDMHTAKPLFDSKDKVDCLKLSESILHDLESLKSMDPSPDEAHLKYESFLELSKKIDKLSYFVANGNNNFSIIDSIKLNAMLTTINEEIGMPYVVSGKGTYRTTSEKIIEVMKEELDIASKSIKKINVQSKEENSRILNSLNLKNAFIRGEAEQVDKSLVSEDATEPVLIYGPKNKNIYTYQLETIIKAMLKNKDFEVTNNDGVYKIKLNDEIYNMNEIMRYANFSHLVLDENDHKRYMDMLCNPNAIIHPYDGKSYAKDLTGLAGEEKLRKNYELMDQSFLQTIDDYNNSKPEKDRDDSLKNISMAERMAINAYTIEDFCPTLNAVLRGDIGAALDLERIQKGMPRELPEGATKELTFKEFLCTCAMCMHGLSYIPDVQSERQTFRGEDNLRQNFYDQRVSGVKENSVVNYAGFISTRRDVPDARFAFKEESDTKIGILFQVFGKDISAISQHRGENEVLGFGSQAIFSAGVKTADNETIFKAHIVDTLTGMSAEQLISKNDINTPEINELKRKVKKIALKHKAGLMDDITYNSKLEKISEALNDQMQLIINEKQRAIDQTFQLSADDHMKIDKLYNLMKEYNEAVNKQIPTIEEQFIFMQKAQSMAKELATIPVSDGIVDNHTKAIDFINMIQNDMQFQALRNEFINANPELSADRKEEILQQIQDLKGAVSFGNKPRLDGLEQLISASVKPPTPQQESTKNDLSNCMRHACKFSEEKSYDNLINLVRLSLFHEHAGAHGNSDWKVQDNEVQLMSQLLNKSMNDAKWYNPKIVKELNEAINEFQKEFGAKINQTSTLSEPIVTPKNQYPQNLHAFKRALKASHIPITQAVQQEKEQTKSHHFKNR